MVGNCVHVLRRGEGDGYGLVEGQEDGGGRGQVGVVCEEDEVDQKDL